MTFVEELCDDLASEGLFVKGTSCFYNHMPDTDISPATIVVIYDRGGIPNSVQPAPQIMVNFMVRSATDFDTAREAAAKIYTRYHGVDNLTLTDRRVVAAMAQGLPSTFGEDQNKRHLVGFNMMFKVVNVDQTIGITATGIGGAKDPNIPTT